MGLTSNTGPYNAAANVYGVDDPVMTKIPRSKFQFMVELTLNDSIPLLDESYGRQFIFDRVQTVSIPDQNHNVVRVNQYNRPRYVPTRLEINPSTIIFYDTKDSQFQYLLQAYARHYFHGHNIDERTMVSYDTIAPAFDGTFGTKAVPTSQRFFFERIRIISTDTANSGRVISLYNCMITNVSGDTLSYSDSGMQVWSVQFQPEHMNIESSGVDNGQSSNPADNVTQAYDVVRSAAAGVLLDSFGNVIRDATGSTIPFTNVGNFAETATSQISRFVTDRNGNPVLDSIGNPVLLSTANNIATQISTSTTPPATQDTRADGFIAPIQRVLNELFGG
jgi:hypothetical protein